MQTKNTKQGGFTLVEIAIVLVIIGLLLGGILKGQELINNAKVRSVADRQNSLKAAWFGFIDRYNFIPGDSRRARQLVPGALGRPDSDTQAGDGILSLGESVLAMQQLTGAGFLRCPQCDGDPDAPTDTETSATKPPDAENSLINQYSGVMSIWNESAFYAARSAAVEDTNLRLQIHSGPRIPSNILSEVDRKIDDGIANSGDMVWNGFDPTPQGGSAPLLTYTSGGTGSQPSDTECMDGGYRQAEESVWRSANRAGGAVENNCGSSVFI